MAKPFLRQLPPQSSAHTARNKHCTSHRLKLFLWLTQIAFKKVLQRKLKKLWDEGGDDVSQESLTPETDTRWSVPTSLGHPFGWVGQWYFLILEIAIASTELASLLYLKVDKKRQSNTKCKSGELADQQDDPENPASSTHEAELILCGRIPGRGGILVRRGGGFEEHKEW